MSNYPKIAYIGHEELCKKIIEKLLSYPGSTNNGGYEGYQIDAYYFLDDDGDIRAEMRVPKGYVICNIENEVDLEEIWY